MATANVISLSSSPRAQQPLVTTPLSSSWHKQQQQQQQQQQELPPEKHVVCRACRSTAMRVDWAAGDRICTDCGVVDEQHLLDDSPEWREFDDSAPTAPVRCGLVPSNETRWIGGLQPTTLSKSVWGGATLLQQQQHASRTRRILVQCHVRIEKRMEQRYKRSVEHDKMNQLIRKRKRRQQPNDHDHDNAASSFDMQFVVEEEPDVGLATTAALYAEKWSLTRCLLLFGQPQEQASVPAREAECLQELRQNIDAVLTAASRELYTSYSILCKTGRKLHLPEAVVQTAANFMSGYAARKDSLTVRGVASMLKRRNTTTTTTSTSGALHHAAQPQVVVSATVQKQAHAALREYNCIKQYSALAAALLFYTARQNGHFRPLADVCRAVPTDTIKPSPHLEWTKGEPLLKLRHCSKAMSEIKQVFPELVKMQPVPESVVQSSQSSPTNKGVDATSVQNYVSHATHSLRLPPVAEACLHILVPHIGKDAKLPLRTASLTYFLALAGKTMQKLAAQSNHRRKRPRRTAAEPTRQAQPKTVNIKSEIKTTCSGVVQPDKSVSSSADTLISITAEEKAYEMQRVWSTWHDQTPWWRSLAEISKATQVPVHKIQDYYKQQIHPQRHALLKTLTEAQMDHIPLSSILLPQIALAAPLMKHP